MYALPLKSSVKRLIFPIRYIPSTRSPKIENDTVGLAAALRVELSVNRLAFVVRYDKTNVCGVVTPERDQTYESSVLSVSPLKNDFWLSTDFKRLHTIRRISENTVSLLLLLRSLSLARFWQQTN